MNDASYDVNYVADFENAVMNVIDQTDIPIKILGYSRINDAQAANTVKQMGMALNFAGDPFDIPIVPLNEAYDYAINEVFADYVFLKTPLTANSIASISTIAQQHGKTWYTNTTPDNGMDDMKFVGSGLIYMMGGYSIETTPNLMWPSWSPYNPEPFNFNLLPESIDFVHEYYRKTLVPNDFRDCLEPVGIKEVEILDVDITILLNSVVVNTELNNLRYQISNINGSVIKSGRILNGTNNINLDGVNSGVNFISIYSKSLTKTRSFFIH